MRGCLLELEEYVGDDKKKQERYKIIEKSRPHRMVLLRELNDEQYLVAMCKQTNKSKYVRFPTTINENVYVNIKSFQSIDRSFCKVSRDVFPNPNFVVNEIYKLHNSWLVELNRKNKMRRKNLKIEKREKLIIPQKRLSIKALNCDSKGAEIPPHLQWAAKHPYQGGGFSGK